MASWKAGRNERAVSEVFGISLDNKFMRVSATKKCLSLLMLVSSIQIVYDVNLICPNGDLVQHTGHTTRESYSSIIYDLVVLNFEILVGSSDLLIIALSSVCKPYGTPSLPSTEGHMHALLT